MTRPLRMLLPVVATVVLVAACSSTGDVNGSADDDEAVAAAPRAGDERDAGSTEPQRPAAGIEPEAFVPAGPVGSEGAYDALIEQLRDHVPPELRDEVPWPELRHPDPVVAQLQIFDLWVWMASTFPEPRLVEAMAAPGSPSREEIAGIFGRRQADRELVVRPGEPYVAFDHRVVTFESAGLPLWLARDVPNDAVVVYYQDRSGPTEVRDADSSEPLGTLPAVAARQWLSIMVPTDVGWLLFRDQLIESGDPQFEVPDAVPPPAGDGRTVPEV